MSISTDYSSPVLVNGFACRNCEDVANAKKGVDPDDPAAGPYGRDKAGNTLNDSAVTFDGLLEALNASSPSDDTPGATQDKAQGCIVDVCA